jgi:general stress protein 26
MIRRVRIALLTRRGHDGSLRARAATTQNLAPNDDGLLFFFVPPYSDLAGDLVPETVLPVGVVDADAEGSRFVSLTGHARLRRDAQRQVQLVTQPARASFAGGAHDPDLRLLAVRAQQAEYLEVKSHEVLRRLDLDPDAPEPPWAAATALSVGPNVH